MKLGDSRWPWNWPDPWWQLSALAAAVVAVGLGAAVLAVLR